MNPIPYVVTIDTEEEWDWSGQYPVSDLCVDNIAKLPDFQRLCDQYGVRPTYFVNHAVLNEPASREVIAGLATQDNLEIGMHLHPWNTPPLVSQPDFPRDTFAHNLGPSLIEEKLSVTWEALDQIGQTPTSYRGGRYSSGEITQRFLVKHGFVVDASVCPYSAWSDDGAPDYRHRSPLPQRVSIPQAGELWEVPLTLAYSRRPFDTWSRVFQTVENSWLSRLRLIGLMQRLAICRKVWLNFECEDPGVSIDFLRWVARRRVLPLCCFTVHSSSLAVGPGPYCRNEEDRRRIYGGIERVFRFLADSHDYQPMTMTELATSFAKQ